MDAVDSSITGAPVMPIGSMFPQRSKDKGTDFPATGLPYLFSGPRIKCVDYVVSVATSSMPEFEPNSRQYSG